jgi:lambda family phage portal protein
MSEKQRASWIDNFIGVFSPRARFKRLQYKTASDLISRRKYEGADAGRRTEGWVTVGTDANSEIGPALARLRNRARDLVRNNPWAARGIQVIVSNVVGRGIMGQVKMDPSRRGGNRNEADLNATWKTWAGTTACDYDGRHNLFGLQRLVMRGLAEGGDVLVRRRRVQRQEVTGPDGIRRAVPPVQLQVLEGDFLNTTTSVGRLTNGNQIIQGIEIDPNGKRVAYHVYQDHPGAISRLSAVSRFTSNRIDADEIRHVFRTDRAGQVRGITWLANAILRLKDLDDYEDAQLIRQKIAACFAVFVRDASGVDAPLTDAKKVELGEKVEPGIIEVLPPNKDISFAKPPEVRNYKEYVNVVLKSIAAGLGITYESMTGDLSDVNFSSARMGWLEMGRNVDMWRNNIMLAQFLFPAFEWFVGGAELIGKSTQGARITWTPPRREMIDPTKEVPAIKTAIRSGITTLSEAIRQSGRDPEDVLGEIARDNKELDRLKLTLDTDPRKVQKDTN